MGCSATYFYGKPGGQQWKNVVSIFAAHNDLKSEKTSSLPLVQFWRDKDIDKNLLKIAPLRGVWRGAQLCFEYAVPPQGGTGKASMTDLMIITKDKVVAVEAKYRECAEPYETVCEWRKKRNPKNRSKVLRGWLECIDEAIGGLAIDKENPVEIQTVPYQLIHRIASACKVAADNTSEGHAVKPIVVYQLFYDDNTKASMKRFAVGLHSAFAALKLTGKIAFLVIATPVTQFPSKPPKELNDLFLEMLKRKVYAFGESCIVSPPAIAS